MTRILGIIVTPAEVLHSSSTGVAAASLSSARPTDLALNLARRPAATATRPMMVTHAAAGILHDESRACSDHGESPALRSVSVRLYSYLYIVEASPDEANRANAAGANFRCATFIRVARLVVYSAIEINSPTQFSSAGE